MRITPLASLLALVLAGCGGGGECTDVLCGACEQPVRITVSAPGATGVTMTGAPFGGDCSETATAGTFLCLGNAGAGSSFTVTLEAPGFEAARVDVEVGAAPPGCCTCPAAFERSVTLVDRGTDGGTTSPDGGAGSDAGSSDAGSSDAGSSDAGGSDAGSADAGASCVESAVRFIPSGGSLGVGQLCDDVFVCAADAGEAARVTAASSRFACSASPEGPCSGWTCAYRSPGGPSTIDAAELAEICAVTAIVPTPDVVCMIYL